MGRGRGESNIIITPSLSLFLTHTHTHTNERNSDIEIIAPGDNESKQNHATIMYTTSDNIYSPSNWSILFVQNFTTFMYILYEMMTVMYYMM